MSTDGPAPVLIRMGGKIHVRHDSEHLICNSATSDAADTECDETLRWHPTNRKTVTCGVCADIVRLCRNVKLRGE